MVGIEKIKEAEIELKKLNEDLAVQKVKVIKRTEEVEALLKEIADGTAEASEKKELAIIKSKEIEEQTKVIDKEKVNSTYCAFQLNSRFSSIESFE